MVLAVLLLRWEILPYGEKGIRNAFNGTPNDCGTHNLILNQLLQITLSQPCAPDINTLHFHVLRQTFEQTLSAQSAALPTPER